MPFTTSKVRSRPVKEKRADWNLIFAATIAGDWTRDKMTPRVE